MRKFTRIKTDVVSEDLYSLIFNQKHIRVGFDFNDSEDVELVRDILIGVTRIEFKALQTKTVIVYAREEDKDYMSSIVNFYNNKYSVDGFFYRDLSGLEASIFEDQKVNAYSLKFPFTEEEKELFIGAR